MRRCLFILLLLFSITPWAYAQVTDDSISVSARFDRSASTTDEVVQLIVTIDSQSNFNDLDIQLPELADFDVLSEQTNRQFSQINNRVKISFSYMYSLLPKRTGTLRVPSFQVNVLGRTFRTEPLTLRVSEGQSITDIIVRQMPNKQQAYVGEQIVVSLEILFRIGIDSYEITDEIQPQGFIIEYDESTNPNALTDTVEVEGVPYRRALIRRSILFPISPGEKQLEPINFLFRYRPQRFDFNSRLVRIATEPIDIAVSPLPESAPSDFTGAVGDYSVEWSIDSTQGKANDPLTLSIDLSGVGDLERAPDIRPALPMDFEILEGSVSANAHFTNGFWGGTKRWEYIVIPKRSGNQQIGPLRFSFFDPDTKTYQQAETEPISLTIEEAERNASFQIPARTETESTEGDIRYISTGEIRNHGSGFIGGIWFWTFVLAPPALNLLLLLLRTIVGSMRSTDVRGARRRTALTEALNKLDRVKRTGERAAMLTLLRKAIVDYFADKIEVDAAGLTLADIRAEMVRRDLHEEESFKSLADIILACEAERYSPNTTNTTPPTDLVKRAANSLNVLEQRL